MPPKKAKGGAVAAGPAADAKDKSKVAELSKQLTSLQGKSLISIAVPAGGDLAKAVEWVEAEQGKASALKIADARRLLSEVTASAKEKLKNYSQVPPNGLLVFCGEAQDKSGKGKVQKLAIEFTPYKPIMTSHLVLDSSFSTGALRELLDENGGSNPEEEAVLAKFMDEVTRSSGKAAYGKKDTIQALQGAAVVTLIVWDGLDLRRVRVRGKQSAEETDRFVTPAEEQAGEALKSESGGYATPGEQLECVESGPFVDWIRDHSWVFGVELQIISGNGEGARNLREGYGGIGALLRYRMDFEPLDE